MKADYRPLLRLRKTRVEHAGSMGAAVGRGASVWGRCSYHPPMSRSLEESVNSCLPLAFLTTLKGGSGHLQGQSRLEQARPRIGEDAEIRGQGGWGSYPAYPRPIRWGLLSCNKEDLGFRVHLCLLHGAGRPCCSVRGGEQAATIAP